MTCNPDTPLASSGGTIRLASRLSTVRPSPTLAITRLANELRRQGRDIIGLAQGEPDFDTPAHVKATAKAVIDAGQTKYTDVDGSPELKRAIMHKFKTERGELF
jgi:aspartate aminotransferase